MRNWVNGVLVIAIASGISACGDTAEQTDDNQFNSVTTSGEQMQPGLWSQSISVEKFEVPGAPPGAETMLQQAFGEGAQEACLTQAQLDEGIEKRAQDAMQGQSCEIDGFENELGIIDGTMTCDGGAGNSSVVKVSGNYDADSLEMLLDMTAQIPGTAEGEGKMVLKMTSERTGDCSG